jgi:hypothetical protein
VPLAIRSAAFEWDISEAKLKQRRPFALAKVKRLRHNVERFSAANSFWIQSRCRLGMRAGARMATARWVVKGRSLSWESFGQLRDPVLNGQSPLPRGTIVVGFFTNFFFRRHLHHVSRWRRRNTTIAEADSPGVAARFLITNSAYRDNALKLRQVISRIFENPFFDVCNRVPIEDFVQRAGAVTQVRRCQYV